MFQVTFGNLSFPVQDSEVLMILSYGFSNFFSHLCFLSRNPLLTFLLSYRFRVTSKIQVNSRFERYSEVLMIVSYGFSQFL